MNSRTLTDDKGNIFELQLHAEYVLTNHKKCDRCQGKREVLNWSGNCEHIMCPDCNGRGTKIVFPPSPPADLLKRLNETYREWLKE